MMTVAGLQKPADDEYERRQSLIYDYCRDNFRRHLKIDLSEDGFHHLPPALLGFLLKDATKASVVSKSKALDLSRDLPLETRIGSGIVRFFRGEMSLTAFLKSSGSVISNLRKDSQSNSKQNRALAASTAPQLAAPQKPVQAKRPSVTKQGQEAVSTIEKIKSLRKESTVEAAHVARELVDFELTHSQRKLIGFTLYNGGNVTDAKLALDGIDEARLDAVEAMRLRRIRSENAALEEGVPQFVKNILRDLETLEPGVRPIAAEDHSGLHVAYVAASAMPQNTAGYAIRTQKVVEGLDRELKAIGGSLSVATRPGYPVDRFDLNDHEARAYSKVGDITFTHFPDGPHMQDDLRHYFFESAKRLSGWFAANQISSVIAASNFVNAFPAYLAAQRIGIPFSYEMRGLWEETKASKVDHWYDSERFAIERAFETYLAHNSDFNFYITPQVRGVFSSKMDSAKPMRAGQLSDLGQLKPALLDHKSAIAPNCADMQDVAQASQAPYEGAQEQKLRLAYIGSVVEYEGLQLLLETLADYPDLSAQVEVDIVGDGAFKPNLEALIKTYRLTNIKMHGRIPYEDVSAFYDRAHIILVPRLPYRVCRLVSPLKPLEAMASGRIVLASDVEPIADLIKDKETGYLFEAGNKDDLAKTLRDILSDRSRHINIAQAAQAYVSEKRNWSLVARDMAASQAYLAREMSPV